MSSTRTEKPLKTILQPNLATVFNYSPIPAATARSHLSARGIRLMGMITINCGYGGGGRGVAFFFVTLIAQEWALKKEET